MPDDMYEARIDGVPRGPFDAKELAGLEGFNADTPVRPKLRPDQPPAAWTAAKEIPELADSIRLAANTDELTRELARAAAPHAFADDPIDKPSGSPLQQAAGIMHAAGGKLKAHSEDLFAIQTRLASQLEQTKLLEERLRKAMAHLDRHEQESERQETTVTGAMETLHKQNSELQTTMTEIVKMLAQAATAERPAPAPIIVPQPAPPAPPPSAADRFPAALVGAIGVMVLMMAAMIWLNAQQSDKLARALSAEIETLDRRLQDSEVGMLTEALRERRRVEEAEAARAEDRPEKDVTPKTPPLPMPDSAVLAGTAIPRRVSADGVYVEVSAYAEAPHPILEGVAITALADVLRDPTFVVAGWEPPEPRPMKAALVAGFKLGSNYDDSVDDGVIYFRVERAKLADPDGGAVFLARRDPAGDWTAMPTTFRGEAGGYLQFKARVTRLGSFAILRKPL